MSRIYNKLGNTDTVRQIITWSGQISANFLKLGFAPFFFMFSYLHVLEVLSVNFLQNDSFDLSYEHSLLYGKLRKLPDNLMNSFHRHKNNQQRTTINRKPQQSKRLETITKCLLREGFELNLRTQRPPQSLQYLIEVHSL